MAAQQEYDEVPRAIWQAAVAGGETVESYRQWARQYVGLSDQEADEKVTCKDCSAELPDSTRCTVSDDGEHFPDMDIVDPPADEPTRLIRLDLIVRVPNDEYDYTVDIGGRIERFASRLLDDRLITSVRTSGTSGSGFAGNVEDK